MHLKSDDITRLEIEYDSGTMPAPFSHIFKLKVSFEKSFINTQFDIHYTDREDLTEEEILNEGFTLNDDYSFIGEIPQIWEQPFKTLYSQSKWSNKKMLDPSGGIKVLAKDYHGQITRTIPHNQEEWQYLAQEYIQAIYEINKKEALLTLKYKVIDQEGEETNYELTVRFSTRKIDLYVNGEAKEADWEETKPLLSSIFLPDYDYGTAKETPPTKKGTYIDCGDGFWHEFGKGIVNIDDSFDAISRIKEGFMKLNQQ
ncbi:MAG: hypothetical protein WD426_17240 [Anditalea sp.]